MAQLRQDYSQFEQNDTVILVLAPEGPGQLQRYWQEQQLPFIALPDIRHTVLKLYGQEVNLFRLGRMPAQVIVDKNGEARYAHYGHSMSDIPLNQDILPILKSLNREEKAAG